MSRIPVGRGAIGEQSHAWLALRSGDVAPFFALALAKPALGLSRAADETGYVQPSYRQNRAVRGSRSIYHNNSIQSWLVQENGEVKNVQLS